MVKEDSFGLFGRVGRGRGGCWRKEERGGGPGEGAGEREGVRVFGQQPPGVWSLSNTRDIRGQCFLCLGGGYGSLDFRGYVL